MTETRIYDKEPVTETANIRDTIFRTLHRHNKSVLNEAPNLDPRGLLSVTLSGHRV